MPLNDQERRILIHNLESKLMSDRKMEWDEVAIASLVAVLAVMMLVVTACLVAETYIKVKNNGSRTTTAIELNLKK